MVLIFRQHWRCALTPCRRKRFSFCRRSNPGPRANNSYGPRLSPGSGKVPVHSSSSPAELAVVRIYFAETHIQYFRQIIKCAWYETFSEYLAGKPWSFCISHPPFYVCVPRARYNWQHLRHYSRFLADWHLRAVVFSSQTIMAGLPRGTSGRSHPHPRPNPDAGSGTGSGAADEVVYFAVIERDASLTLKPTDFYAHPSDPMCTNLPSNSSALTLHCHIKINRTHVRLPIGEVAKKAQTVTLAPASCHISRLASCPNGAGVTRPVMDHRFRKKKPHRKK